MFLFNIICNFAISYFLVGFILIAAMIQGDSFTILCKNSKLLLNDVNIYLIEYDRFEDANSSSLFIFGPDGNIYLVIKGILTPGQFIWPKLHKLL